MTTLRQSAPEGRPDLPAELALRFGAERLPGRVYWPAAISAPPLIFLLENASDGDVFSPSLCSAAAAVVLSMPTRPGLDERLELAALGWAAEHAAELGATTRLLLGGVYLGGGHAARLALTVHDAGWPTVGRQLLVHPSFDAGCPIPSRVGAAAPATIVWSDAPGERYAAELRAAGIDVEELRVRDRCLPRGAELAALVRSLGVGATDELSNGRQSYQVREAERRPR